MIAFASCELEEQFMEVGNARMSMCELRMISAICNGGNFERILCDLRSRSLGQSISFDRKEMQEKLCVYLSVFSGFIVRLHVAQNTKKASLR